MTHYIALIHKEADSGYGVSFPDVPGVIAVADTLDEALHEASLALGFAFEIGRATALPHALSTTCAKTLNFWSGLWTRW